MFDQLFINLAEDLNLPLDQLRYITCILLTYPLALIHIKFIPNNSRLLKNIFSIISTSFLFLYIHGETAGFYHFILSCIITYSILYLFKGSDLSAKLVFAWAMLHMSYTHIYRQINDYGLVKMDYSGPQMVWTIKLTMFAFNVYDGQRSIKELTPYQIERRIEKLPSVIDFLGYMLYFGGFFVGPAFDYYEYEKFLKAEYLKKDNKSGTFLPKTLFPALKCFLVGLICAIVPIFISPHLNISAFVQPWFYQQGFFTKLFYIVLIPTLERFKYYFVWLLSEGAFILSGFGYVGKPGQEWGGITNINILKVEIPENLKMLLEHWNMATNVWLRNYVYLRLTPPGTKPTFFAQISTFFVSAFWHGFYPGYYITFLFAGFVNELARKIRRTIRPIVLSYNSDLIKKIYDIIGTISTLVVLNYLVVPFLSLDLHSSLNIMASVYFCIHIIVFSSLFLLDFIPNKVKVAKVAPTSINPITTDAPKSNELNNSQNNKKVN